MSNDNRSPHILNTSSQLLGLCFIVMTALKVQNLTEATIIDEITALAAILFMTSSLLSFLSMRSKTKRGESYEKIADFFFLTGLLDMFILIIIISFNIVE